MSLATPLCAQTTTKQAAKVSRGSVSGRVTIKENGVAGVAVGLRRAEAMMISREPFLRTTTDQDGFYRFGNLAPGNYSITPSVPAYVMARKDPESKTVLIGEDESVEGINFALIRGGVITGRVTDADGRPVIEQQVNLYKVENLEKRLKDQPMYSERSVETDDRGIYRIFGLSAGRYKVAAGRTDDNAYNYTNPERANYLQVFHPDATDHAKATVIEVSEGSEAGNVDIALGRALRMFNASGVAVDEKGVPVPNLRFEVQRRIGQRTEFVNAAAVSNNRGEFVIEGLIPGKYGISISTQLTGVEMHAEPLSFDIVDEDIGGLTLRLSKGASLTGIVVLENEDKSLFSKLTEIQLRAFAMVQSGMGDYAVSPIGTDGSFRLAGLPGGTINLMLGSMFNPVMKGFFITRVERDGVVLPSSRMEIKDGEQLTGVRVIVVYGTATLRGTVKLENGSLPEGARIIIRLAKPGEPLSNLRPAIADERGHFLMDGMPAGTYELSTMITGTSSAPPRTVKREVTLPDGQVTEVTITVDMAAPVKP
jgi:hypothetical protein